MKQVLRRLFLDTLADLQPQAAMPQLVRREADLLQVGPHALDLSASRRVFVIAFGKAARGMAAALLPLLHGCRVQGLLVPPAGDAAPLPPLEVIAGGHPLPDAGSVRAAERALALLGNAGPGDLVLFLPSGGGSAMFERPIDPRLSLADLQQVHRLLVHSGAGIVAINAVRKHLSGVKGGRLALRAAHAEQLTILCSDVPPAHPDAVASGPTFADPSTLDDVAALLAERRLSPQLPPTVRSLLQRGNLPETPKPGDPAFARHRHVVLLDNDIALARLQQRAADAGLLVERLAEPGPDSTPAGMDGEPGGGRATAQRAGDLGAPHGETVGQHPAGAVDGQQAADPAQRPGAGEDLDVDTAAGMLLAQLQALRRRHPGRPVAVIAGGELSVPLPPRPGTGGRNQQFALACALRIAGQPIAVLSAGTDGIDGNSPAAGAAVDGSSVPRAADAGFDAVAALAACDAHPLLAAIGGAIVTGPSGTNVRDLRIAAAGELG